MQRPGHGAGEGEACVTENGARAKRGELEDEGRRGDARLSAPVKKIATSTVKEGI